MSDNFLEKLLNNPAALKLRNHLSNFSVTSNQVSRSAVFLLQHFIIFYCGLLETFYSTRPITFTD